MLGPLMDTIHIKSKFHIRDLKFVYNMKISENKLAQSCFRVAYLSLVIKLHILGVNLIFLWNMTIYERELASLKTQLKFVRKCNSLSIISCH